MEASTMVTVPFAPCAGAGATTESVHMVEEASLRKTWAASFSNTATLRATVSTNTEAYTAFEEELVRELNELRRAPAAYAAVVEREATVGAPYVQENDLYFCDESAAESAAVEFRRTLEEQYCPVQAEVSSAAGAPVSRGVTHVMSPKAGVQTGPEKRRGKKGLGVSLSPPATSTGVGASSGARYRSSRTVPASERQNAHTVGPDGGAVSPSRREVISPELTGGGVTVVGVSSLSATRATLRNHGLHELTLSQLRHQFRCQQRYRAALEAALRDMRASQRQAEAAQQAAWASEDEKALKKSRRFMTTSSFSANTGSSAAALQSNNSTGDSSASVVVPHSSKKLSNTNSSNLPTHTSGPTDDHVALRRSEDMAQLRGMHEARIKRMEQELCDVRNACQRSLAAANLVLDAVRALREAQPAPLVQRHRGLSLAARDTAETYYGDEERVAALQELYAVSRATLVGLAEHPGAPTTSLTLERLSRRLEQHQVEVSHTKMTAAGGSHSRCDRVEEVEESDTRERSETETVPSWVLPLLSEEALLLTNVARDACTTYGYISGEVRGLHLQVMAGSPRSLLLQMIIGSLTPVLDLSSHSLQQCNGQAARRISTNPTPHSTNATQCYAGVRIEGCLYAVADPPTSTSDDAVRLDLSQFQVASSKQEAGEQGSIDETSAVWLSKEVVAPAAAEQKCSNGGTGATTATSHAQRAAAAAAQRLWPLLWAGAYTIGCSWQQVRGWRHVPTFTEACERRQMTARASSGALTSRDPQSPFTEGAHAVICTTLLFASGFEEYEVVRGCRHMSPAAARRVVQSTLAAVHEGGPQSSRHGGGLADAVDARRAAVDVHSTLGVTLLTPTMHPVQLHANDLSCCAVCVAVRVPCTSPGLSATHSSTCAGADGRVRSGSCHDSSIRIVAQVTRQCELTPPHPTTCAAEVLVQRSPVDPSVWLVLVDTASAFQRHAAAVTDNSGAVLNADGLCGADGTAITVASTVVPLALHIYAKDMSDAMGEFEHVAFIRMQQYLQPREMNAGAVVTATSAAPAMPAPSVLVAPEWRYLLNGLACAVASPLSQTATSLIAISHPAAQVSVLSRSFTTTPTAVSAGWPTLHEPLLGRDGVLLCPLSADFRESERCGDVPQTLHVCHETTSGGRGSEAAAAAGRAIRVAVQLPVNCTERWWRRRVSTLRHLQTKLTDEVVAEGDEQTAVSAAQSPNAAGTDQDQPLQLLVEGGNLPVTECAPPSDDTHAGATGTAFGASDGSGATATASVASTGAAAECTSVVAEAASAPFNGRGAGKKKMNNDGRRAANKSTTSDAARGSGARAQGSHSSANNAPADASKRKVQMLYKDGDSAMASSAATPAAAAATGSFPAPTQARRRTLSGNATPKLQESGALREYEAIVERAAALKPVATRSGNVQACLQPSLISIIDLRGLSARLHADLHVWEAYLTRVRFILSSERDRIAAEINKKKGKEQLRLQHDHDDVVSELQVVEKGVASLRQAAVAATDALRTRERTQVLRRARLVRIAAELAAIEPWSPSLVLKDSNDKLETTQSQRMPLYSAAPNVVLRLFDTAAVAAGSGRDAVFHAVRLQQHLSSERADMLNRTVGEGAARLSARAAGEVALLPQPSLAHGTTFSSSPSSPPQGDGDGTAVVYAAICSIPLTFAGHAALYIDDEIAVTWSV
nr:unnamed protein product [Leishmania braziliensis]